MIAEKQLKNREKLVGPNTSLRVSRFRGTRPQSLIALAGRGSYYSLFTSLDTNFVERYKIMLKGANL